MKLDVLFRWILAIFGIYIAYQIIRILFGGSWNVNDVILALVVLNITLTFTSIMHSNSKITQLTNKINQLSTKLHGHLEWHKGRDSKANL